MSNKPTYEELEQRVEELEQDTVKRKETEKALRKSETRIRYAQEVAGLGFWDWNVVTGNLYWSDQIYLHYGFEPQEFVPTFETFSSIVHPDDLEFVLLNVNGALQNNTAYDIEFRFIRTNDEVRHSYTKGEVARDNAGNALRFVGSQIDITDRKKAEETLRGEKSLTEEYINSLPGLFYVFDEKRFIQWNKQWGKVTGYSEFEISKMYGPDFFEGSDRFVIADRMSETFVKGVTEAEAELITKYGKRIPYYFSGLRKTINGKPHLIGLGIDITELKKAEKQIKSSLKEKEILLQEIHHRVKNNMQVISGLLSLQADSSEDERIKQSLKESQNRVYAMSTVHETIYSSGDLSEIDLCEYLSKITNMLTQAYAVDLSRIGCRIDCDDIKIGVEQASPLGLIINEIVSNSLIHAFPDGKTGEIFIKIRKFNPEDIEVIIMDNGIGLPIGFNWQENSNLGLQLVKGLVENQLEGHIVVTENGGAQFQINFKLI